MFTKDDVAKLVSDLGERKIDPPLELGEPHSFGLGLDALDPVSGHILTLARPHRADIGQTEILRTVDHVVAHVQGLRLANLHARRAAGEFVPTKSEETPAEPQPAPEPQPAA